MLVVACGVRDDPGARDALQAVLASSPAFVEAGARGASAWRQTREFYAQRGERPAWFESGRVTSHLDELVDALLRAGEHGLDPADYGAEEVRRLREQGSRRWFGGRLDDTAAATLEARLSYAFLRLAADLAHGRVGPGQVSRHYFGTRPREDLVTRLREAVDSRSVEQTLFMLAPTSPQYTGLQLALARYRAAAPDGALAADPEQAWRVRQIEMNMERWRWAPRDLGAQHILVNVAGYELQAIEGYRPVLAMRVVVGEPVSPTPLFSDRMTYVVFSPYWNIPESILREETLAQVAEDPAYLSRSGIEIVRTDGEATGPVDPDTIDWSRDPAAQGLRFRQVPGPENALGLVKFIFPNHFSVYLHHTPDSSVFSRARRAYSHGCVRVEDPVGLAEYVLRGQREWTRERIVEAMLAGQERIVRLPRPLPVHLGYWTAWVQPEGTVAFTDDPYGLDRRHDQALRGSRSTPAPPKAGRGRRAARTRSARAAAERPAASGPSTGGPASLPPRGGR
jgi:murein L,D-transpeptidase YcbB/YkuD